MTSHKNTRRNNKEEHALDDLPLFVAAQTPPSLKVLRLPDVIARVGLKRASIYKRISEGQFPKAIPLGSRAVGWLEHEIDEWLHQRLRARHERDRL